MKLKTKITLVLILISIVATLTIAVFTAVNTKSLFDSYIDNYRESRQEQWGRVLQEYYAERGSWVGVNSILPQVREHEVQGMMRGRKVTSSEQIFLVDSNGVYIAPIGKNAINYPNSTQLTKATPIKVDGELIGSVYLKVPDDDLQGFATLENHFISSVFYFSLGAGLLVAFFAVFIGIAFSNKIVRPLNQLKETTKRFSDGEWDVKIDLDGSDEISELAQAFNMMGQKLQEAELARKTLVADVAHELRNPLATLRAQLESIQEGVAQPNPQIVLSLNDEVIKLGRLVNDLQDLSLAEVGRLRLKKERADVGKVIKKITNVFETSLGDKEIELVLDFEEKIEMEIDPHRINQVIVNLLANAVRHTPQGKKIVITLKEINNSVHIEVFNEGLNIPEADLPFIFQRFYRSDKGRTREQGGTGLGLAITKGLVQAHNGDIGVENMPTGVRFFVILPRN